MHIDSENKTKISGERKREAMSDEKWIGRNDRRNDG